ncbi:MAG: hypothetical protein SGJ20_06600 [Planctomycetota bacterium]|nr:hypothetical protein [Planctomycetota bacterium]
MLEKHFGTRIRDRRQADRFGQSANRFRHVYVIINHKNREIRSSAHAKSSIKNSIGQMEWNQTYALSEGRRATALGNILGLNPLSGKKKGPPSV